MKAEITAYGVGKGSVLLDGQDISKGVSAFTLTGGANSAPVLDLQVRVHEGVHFHGEVEVAIPDAVRKILLHLGWTPPAAAATTMPVFTIKAKDALAVRVIKAYRDLCSRHGLHGQASEVQLAINEIELWQQDHEDEVQLPDHLHVPAAES